MIGPIPSRPIGVSAKARFFQWVWERLARGQHDVYAGPGIRVTKTARGMMVESLDRGGSNQGDSRVKQYLLTDATAGDYFVCRSLSVSLDTTDPENPIIERTIGAEDIFIAKPFHLRQSAFDRDTLNEETPGNIGTTDEITYDVYVEAWDGVTFDQERMAMSFEYKSATFRIATNATDPDPDNWRSQNQTIIPRFAPALLDEPEEEDEDQTITNNTISATIIYAVKCSGLGITRPGDDDSTIDVTLLALSDGWAWAKTSS